LRDAVLAAIVAAIALAMRLWLVVAPDRDGGIVRRRRHRRWRPNGGRRRRRARVHDLGQLENRPVDNLERPEFRGFEELDTELLAERFQRGECFQRHAMRSFVNIRVRF
jgi:hypothetical protein